jgi:hypothetical protein
VQLVCLKLVLLGRDAASPPTQRRAQPAQHSSEHTAQRTASPLLSTCIDESLPCRVLGAEVGAHERLQHRVAPVLRA